MDQPITAEDVLAHFGVRGMHWGVRRNSSTHPTSADAARVHEITQKVKKGKTSSLSNEELQHLVTRMNLEQQFSNLSSKNKKSIPGAKFAKDIVAQVGRQQAINLANNVAGNLVKKHIHKLIPQ